MPFNPTSGATLRADINAVVEEAAASSNYFIGSRALPPFLVDAKSGTYPKIQIAGGELMTPGSTVRSRSGSYSEVSRQWTSDTYDCLDRGLEEPVDDTDQKDLARFFNLEATTAKWLLRNMRLDHEVRAAAVINSTGNFGAATNSAVAYTEANIATISFVADVLAAIERCRDNGCEANTIILSSTVYQRIRRATPTVNFVRGSIGPGAEVTGSTLAKAFADDGITQCLIGGARYNAAKKGQAKSMSSVWGTTYVWVGRCADNAMSLQEGGAAHTLVWNAEGGLWVSESYRDESRRSNIVRVRQNTTEKCIDGTAGTLIATQWS